MAENEALAARMTELGIGASQLARTLGISQRTVTYWLSGKITWPNEPTRSKAVKLLRVNNAGDIGFIQPVRRYLGRTTYEPTIVPDGRDWTREAATDRRDALRAGGAALAGMAGGAALAGMPGGAGLAVHRVLSEPDHMTAALDAGSVHPDRLSELERTTDELSAGMARFDKSVLLGRSVDAFATVRRLVRQRQRTADQVRLVRTGARLALTVGEILFDGHEFQLADRWYRTAHRAALDVGDRCLADVVTANQAIVPEYSGQPRGVLALVEPRLESRSNPSAALAFLWGARARAHATLGDRSAFRRAIDKSRENLDAVHTEPAETEIFTFTHRRLAFYETTGFMRLHDVEGATVAADRALSLYRTGPLTRASEPVMVRLDKASALAQAGEIDEACRIASEALTDESAGLASVLIRAREFDALLGSDDSPAVRDWREVLHASR